MVEEHTVGATMYRPGLMLKLNETLGTDASNIVWKRMFGQEKTVIVLRIGSLFY